MMIYNNQKNPVINIPPKDLMRISKAIQENNERMRAVFKLLQPHLEKFVESLKEFPESSKVLAEQGWYMPMDFNFGTANQFAIELKNGNVKIVNERIVNYFDADINHIENVLCFNFPNRSIVLKAGIYAHKERNYYLSIPVFFAQAEGIAKELTTFRFFKTINSKPAIKAWTDEIDSNSIISALLEPLRIQSPMSKMQDHLKPIGFNRHDVLHGDCVDYGDDKINSYKALSLVNYLSETVYMAKEHFEKNKK
jgi:hypothetical protein